MHSLSGLSGLSAMIAAGGNGDVEQGSPLLTGLESYWPLSDLTDSIGGRTLTNNGSATFVAGKIGNAVSLDGATQYLSRANDAVLQTGGGTFTIAFWFKADEGWGGDSQRELIGKLDEWVIVGWAVGGNMDLLLRFSGLQETYHAIGSLSTDWTHVVMWLENGVDFGVCHNNGTPTTGTITEYSSAVSLMGIGGGLGAASTAYGLIDEVGYWSRVLTSDERATLYAAGAGVPGPPDPSPFQ